MMGQWNNQVTTDTNIYRLAHRLNSSLAISQINAYAIQKKSGQEFWAVPNGTNSEKCQSKGLQYHTGT